MSVVTRAVELPGTWTNGKSEFQTVSLMLRSDGQAVFASAVLPAFAQWEKTETGLNVILRGEGQSLTIPLTLDPAAGTLSGKLQDTELVLHKVSDQEPPDMLVQAKERHAEQMARMKKLWRTETRTLADRKAAKVLLQEWLAEANTPQRAESIAFSTTEGKGHFSVRGLNAHGFIDVALESRHVGKLSGLPLNQRTYPADAVSDLPLTYEVPAAQRERLAKLAEEPGVKCDLHVYGHESHFGPEVFSRMRQFVLPPGAKPDLAELAERVMEILWETPPKNITATLHFRVPEGR